MGIEGGGEETAVGRTEGPGRGRKTVLIGEMVGVSALARWMWTRVRRAERKVDDGCILC